MLGACDLEDVLAGVDYLKTQPEVDPEQMGITGTSYGGHEHESRRLMHDMLDFLDQFLKAGVSPPVGNLPSSEK